MDIFYKIVIELDNKLYKKKIEKNSKKIYYRPGPGELFKTKKFWNNYFNQNYNSMKFDTTKKQFKKIYIYKKQFKKKKPVKYYNCGKLGYIK